jgi:hypothetical protein
MNRPRPDRSAGQSTVAALQFSICAFFAKRPPSGSDLSFLIPTMTVGVEDVFPAQNRAQAMTQFFHRAIDELMMNSRFVLHERAIGGANIEPQRGGSCERNGGVVLC